MVDMALIMPLFELVVVGALALANVRRLGAQVSSLAIYPLLLLSLHVVFSTTLSADGMLAFVKVMLFAATLWLAVSAPTAARRALVLTIVLGLVVEGLQGNFASKVSPIPFLVLTAIYLVATPTRRWHVPVAIAIASEMAQAYFLQSRGLYVFAGICLLLYVIPAKAALPIAKLLAYSLPILYPLILFGLSYAFSAGYELINPTGSNVERSYMAAWVLASFFDHVLVGPGLAVFSDQVTTFKEALGYTISDFYDPHQFLLTAWLWFGSAGLALLYLWWVQFWSRQLKNSANLKHDDVKRHLAVLMVNGILIFILHPPASWDRLASALSIGYACATLRQFSTARRKAALRVSPILGQPFA